MMLLAQLLLLLLVWRHSHSCVLLLLLLHIQTASVFEGGARIHAGRERQRAVRRVCGSCVARDRVRELVESE
jgi:hypothetical protein